MGISDWGNRIRDAIEREGVWRGLSTALYELRVGAIRRLAQRSHEPEYIWDRDWDVLVVLDACRLDMMREVAGEYEYIDVVESHTSAATSTTAWSKQNFAPQFADELSETAYVTANPNSITIGDIILPETCSCGVPLSHDHRAVTVACRECGKQVVGDRQHPFMIFDEVWRGNWNDSLGTLLPDTVTARAVEAMREEAPERLIVHYNQPHHPFVARDGDGRRTEFDLGEGTNVWQELRVGNVSRDEVWDAYVDNLRYVLDSLPALLENIDADTVVITSDHGNALGEWGVYGHPYPSVPIEPLVNVPWIETQAQNDRGDEPSVIADEPKSDEVAGEVNERLRDLGYV
ncbi:sulfatase-like hydrolase/transferase [Halobaculum rubrum]|uniref:sulfatase-like hydrolase/transferase n=1 Tax=Halobaculum rubrum TaxID=2872158 RepID=UPI001CA46D62|nr:sulfatase-like hydrolase/transferase [Halobaculum rubrum]QZX99908.1 sulfatase-like hydrolase/transferase [Halobaculum rubrum]